jgi:hypothetical protein
VGASSNEAYLIFAIRRIAISRKLLKAEPCAEVSRNSGGSCKRRTSTKAHYSARPRQLRDRHEMHFGVACTATLMTKLQQRKESIRYQTAFNRHPGARQNQPSEILTLCAGFIDARFVKLDKGRRPRNGTFFLIHLNSQLYRCAAASILLTPVCNVCKD